MKQVCDPTRSLLTCTHILLHVSSMCTAGSLVVWKSVRAEKKGSAALHRSMTLPNTQQLALTRGYLPTSTKLSLRVNRRSSTAIHTGFILISTKLPGLPCSQLFQSFSNAYVMYIEFRCLPWR